MTGSQQVGGLIVYAVDPPPGEFTPTINEVQGSVIGSMGQFDTRMKLLTKALLKQLPPLYATEGQPDPLVICKFFYPDFSWTWYAVEFDGHNIFYGYVDGDFPELGYFSLKELLSTRGKLGLSIERDRWFKPCRLSEIRAKVEKRHQRS